MPKIRLNKVRCNLPDEIDKDEMYLKHDGQKIWPEGSLYHRLDTGDVADIGVVLEVEEGWVEVELWDFDYLSLNDHLGSFKFKVDDAPGAYTNSMKLEESDSTASYFLEWEILDQAGRSIHE